MPAPVSRLALAIGDPNGIGPEIALRTAAAYAGRDDVALTLFGAADVLHGTARALGLQQVLSATPLVATQPMPAGSWHPGEISAAAGAATVDAARQAIEATRRGAFDAVVAAPHHETAIAKAGIAFSGYPSLLARVCGQPEDSVFLLLMGGGLRIVHVTLHESVAHALARLSPELVVQAVLAGLRGLNRLGMTRPRVAVMGINPHAGEGGLFGPEDGAITEPAAAQLRAQGHDVTGPFGGDLLLAARAHDLYVAIFHDQGHIPIKLLSPQRASAWSVGADVILSSVGHGSAMDIAGKGVASARAMIETVALLGHVNAAPGGEGVVP
jgi:4-hydroxythreonine-4-phosphate dehydrogenase/1,2-dihydroxy-3,5-cyclohexadiene-1,4-dicarboxylate dehydrogenase